MFDPNTGLPVSTQPAAKPKSTAKIVSIVLVVALLISGLAFVGLNQAGFFSTEINAEPIASVGADPFSAPVGDGVTTALPALAAAAPTTASGSQTGLYGGTENNKACDAAKLVTYLTENPAKGAAWASVLGIQQSEIPTYVSKLTPVILRVDTAVTNHGFKDGKATTINSVLQAGSAVMVDASGVPRVRCKCGNPLTEGKRYTKTKYTGDKWATFSPSSTTIIQPSVSPITKFSLVDIATGKAFTQTAGSPSALTAPTASPSTTPTTAGSSNTTATTAASSSSATGTPSIDGKTYNQVMTLAQCTGTNAANCDTQRATPFSPTFKCSSATSCTTATGRAYTFSGGVWTTSYAASDSVAFTCDGVPQPTQINVEFTADASGKVSGTINQTAPALPPRCTDDFLYKWTFDASPK